MRRRRIKEVVVEEEEEEEMLLFTFLLSSSTVFMFSIQIASTGPSKISHLRSGDCVIGA